MTRENINELKRRLERAEAIVEALRGNEVDAVVRQDGVAFFRLRETEAKLQRAQEALHTNESRLRRAMAAGRVFSFEWMPATDVVYRSDNAVQILDLDAADCSPTTGAAHLKRICEEDRETFLRTLRGLTSDHAEYHVVYRFVTAAGIRIWLEESGRAEFNEDGGMVRVRGVAADVTDRIENQLRERDAIAAVAASKSAVDTVNAMDVGAVLLHLDGRVITMNPAAEKLCSIQQEDIGAEKLHVILQQLLKGDDLAMALRALDEVAHGRLPELHRAEISKKNGEKVIVSPSIAFVKSAAGMPVNVVLTLQDVTELHRTNQRLRQLTDRLVVAEEQSRRHVSTKIHDQVLQTLSLGNMRLGAISQAIHAAGNGDQREKMDHVRTLINTIIEECRVLLSDLTPPLLYEAGLVPALRDFADTQQTLHGREITVQAGVRHMPVKEEHLGLVFASVRELVTNALKYAGPCEIFVRLTYDGGSECRIEVEDTGKGFDAQNIDRVHDDSGDRFGLFNVRERLKSMDGRFELRSIPGRGTRARLTVPIAETR